MDKPKPSSSAERAAHRQEVVDRSLEARITRIETAIIAMINQSRYNPAGEEIKAEILSKTQFSQFITDIATRRESQ